MCLASLPEKEPPSDNKLAGMVTDALGGVTVTCIDPFHLFLNGRHIVQKSLHWPLLSDSGGDENTGMRSAFKVGEKCGSFSGTRVKFIFTMCARRPPKIFARRTQPILDIFS